jgi:CYTH domain-containing protein
MLDGWIINAWIRHNNHYVIDNSGVGFQAKMDRLYNVVALNVGTPGAKQFMKKYLLEGSFTEASIPTNANVSYVAFTEKFDYIIAEEHSELRWLKEKTDSDGSKSWCSVKRYLSLEHEERREVKKKMSEDMYLDYLKSVDPIRDTIHKKFIYFVTRNQPYMIESFEHEGKTVNLLKIETDVHDHTTQVPEWIKIGKDVTEDPKYFNHNIALKH